MSWETTSVSLDGSSPTMITTTNENDLRQEENEQKRLVQLQNFQRDHKTKEIKSIYHAVMSQFGQMFTENNKKGIAQTILIDDCEIFLFNFAETVPVQYAFRSEGFATLFEDKRVIRREVRETYVSLKKTTGFEICECEVIDETKGSSMSQFSFEIFSFKGEKISKMRLSYGSMPMSYNPLSLFTPTKKERMLAKVKELNYAWADQPDLERIASLMHENTEYKFWSWQDKKCFIFDKNNFVLEFKKSLEEDFIITSVVPYGISSEAQYLYGSYVYHLEGKHNLTGQKFIWVSTCIYTFDQDCNIKKMSQQGELHPEGEILILFQATSMKTLVKHPESRHNNGVSIFDSDWMTFSSDLMIFGADDIYFTGHIKGLSQFGILEKVISNRRQNTEKPRHIDIFDDIDDPCYDGAIVIGSSKGTLNREGHPFHGKPISIYSAGKLSFENGKIAKVLVFPCEILEPIPSPFDDVSFSELNFRPKSEFL